MTLPMKLKLGVDLDIVSMMCEEIAAGEKAVTAAMRDAGTGFKTAWRGQITGAGLGRRLANSIRSQTYPKAGESLNAAALVWSKAPAIVGAHDTGPLIRSKAGSGWRSPPRPPAGVSAAARSRPANGNVVAASASASSIAAAARACWWLRDG